MDDSISDTDNTITDNTTIQPIAPLDIETIQDDMQALLAYSPVEYRFVVARSYSKSSAAALAVCGLSYNWLDSGDRKARLLPLADRLATNRALQAELQIQELVPAALARMADLMDNSADDRVRFQASKDILDRAGVRKQDKLQVDVTGSVSVRSLADVLVQVYGAKPVDDDGGGQVIDGAWAGGPAGQDETGTGEKAE